MGVEANREFASFTEIAAPVADASPGGYSMTPPPNLVHVTNQTGGVIHARMTPAAYEDLVVNGAFAADTDWTKGTNWTISGGKGVHATGSTQAISQVLSLVDLEGALLVYTVSDRTAGGITAYLAGGAGTERTTNATFYEHIAQGTSSIKSIAFVPESTFDGKIDNVAVFQYAAGAGAGLHQEVIADDAGVVLGDGKFEVPFVGIWVPSGGDVTGVNVMGRSIKPRR